MEVRVLQESCFNICRGSIYKEALLNCFTNQKLKQETKVQTSNLVTKIEILGIFYSTKTRNYK